MTISCHEEYSSSDFILNRICPDEANLPPSKRTWARILMLGNPTLEIRDPNSGVGNPEAAARHQYQVARKCLFGRRLPPAPLDQHWDESAWSDEDPLDRDASAWRLVEPGSGLPWEWAVQVYGVQPYPTKPVRVEGEWDIHGDGDPMTIGYIMPPAHPHDIWADVTGPQCPLCKQHLVWYEAGYVPGYRVCMARKETGDYDPDSLRHRWLWIDGILVSERKG